MLHMAAQVVWPRLKKKQKNNNNNALNLYTVKSRMYIYIQSKCGSTRTCSVCFDNEGNEHKTKIPKLSVNAS